MKVGKVIVLSGVIALSGCYSKVDNEKILRAEVICLHRGGIEMIYVNARFVGNDMAVVECANGDSIPNEAFEPVIREAVLAIQAQKDRDEANGQ